MNERRSFTSGVTTLGDILKDYNYNQAFVCGSDADFGGRKSFFEQHGDYKIYDYNTALASNAIPEGYKVWWGFEDEYLYKIAESELALLSESDKPFNLTLLTVDTHHKYGYICGNCNSNYLDRTSNVIDCADRQVANFIKWIKAQPFYDNTTIVITGDHRRMDDALRSEYKNNKRKVYCTIINSPVKPKLIYHERVFSSLDVFPTIVASLGFTIKDNRLGLGVNLYSEKPTLIEQMGFEKLDGELSKHSDYYFKNFP
jgi:phosphoglycerol transferase